MRLLIVDDETAIIAALTPVLAARGFDVLAATTATDALRVVEHTQVALVLLDLGLPDADGVDLITKLKELSDCTVIVLSARHLESEKVRALDEGADDFINKPFGMEELLARLRAARRRHDNSKGAGEDEFISAQLYVHFTRRQVSLAGEQVRLSPKEFALLECLCRNADQVVTQRRLLIAGWNDPTADTQNLRSYIALLRQKLEYDPSEPELVLTEPGVGYRLAATQVPGETKM